MEGEESLLARQVKILAETLQTAIDRMEQVFKLVGEKMDQLSQLTDETLVLNEALKKSLSEADQGIDDLAKVTAALLTQLKTEQQQQHGQSAS